MTLRGDALPITPTLFPEGQRGSKRSSIGVLWSLVGLLLLGACGPASPEEVSEDTDATAVQPPMDPAQTREPFVDVAARVGLDFVHDNGMSGALYYSEMMGGGVALLDYDRDGDLDVYLTDGHPLEIDGQTAGPVGRLYRNDLITSQAMDGAEGRIGELAFTEVTATSGLDVEGYGMGVVAFDFDGDDWLDLYVTQTGPNRLFRNRGDGTFEEVGATAGVDLDSWTVPAVVLDVDQDGWLDLFVGTYVDYSLATNKRCTDALGQANYCGPLAYLPMADHLLRNRGDGTFEDISSSTGIAAAKGRCLGAVAEDFDGDGRMDLYVANDGTANHLWIQEAGLRFTDRALQAGAGVNGQGMPEASMGVGVGDYDGDGDGDIVLGHLAKETNTLFANQGDGSFRDLSARSGLASPSLPMTTFGVSWLDFDNDGHLDLLTTNGAVKIIKELALAGDPHPLHQSNQLYRNRGDGTFEDVSRDGGSVWGLSEVSRGSAVGDLDNDGDSDIVIHNNGGPVRLLRNEVGQKKRWIGVAVLDGGQSPPGTRVDLQLTDGRWLHRSVRLGSSYASSEDPRLIFGLGSSATAHRLTVHWPDGDVEWWEAPRESRYTTLHRGTGHSEPAVAPSED